MSFTTDGLRVHGYQVEAWCSTEEQSGKACGIILVGIPGKEWVTAWYRSGDREWSTGHYFKYDEFDRAWMDFVERASRSFNIPVNWRSPEA